MAQRRRRRNWPPLLLSRIAELTATTASAAEIHRQLKQEAESGRADFGKGDVPALRTLQDIVADYRPPDDSGLWSLADADGDEAALVPPLLAVLARQPLGRLRHPTREQARLIARIRRAAPDLPLGLSLLVLAIVYRDRRNQGMPTVDLDTFLAFAPWRGGVERERYREALREGWIEPGPLYEAITTQIIESKRDTEEEQEIYELEEDNDA